MYKISKHLNWYQYSDKLVIRNLRSSEIFSLDESKKDVWLLICKGHNKNFILDELYKSRKLSRDDLEEEVDYILLDLEDKKLIEKHYS